MKYIVALSTVFIVLTSCKKDETTYRFLKNTTSGIQFNNTLSSTTDLNILNYLYFYNGAGVAIGDFNNDQLEDIYFSSSQGADQLYSNLGHLKFKDITSLSGISNATGWTTGVTTVDINHDGLLDIYISKVSGHLKLKGSNQLYVNQGVINGIPSFKEQAAAYNLDISGLYTQATFFDYDLDGDLDVYLLGHSLYPNAYFGKGNKRAKRDTINGDRLLENKNGLYYDISVKANILSSKIGYGLGVAISDLNNDGYPDIYVGNDFFEDDYLYINQKNGTFKEVHSSEGRLGHTSHFSMGNDIADINNDGLPDILSVDMLPEDLQTLKTSGAEYNYPIFTNQLKQGYQSQFMQNTLHLNKGNAQFSEVAFLSGIASTEWSWSPLLADFDNDGDKDIYITNGILGATNDMDFINFISNDNIQKRLGNRMTDNELPFIAEMPEKKTTNYFFKNNNNLTFTNTSSDWIQGTPSFSNGSAYADLDNDGDLDLVVNNVNEIAYLLENRTQQLTDSLNYLKILFKGAAQNNLGIGAKIKVYTQGKLQLFENFTTRGFLSATSPTLLIGTGNQHTIDSIKVIWPDASYQLISTIKTNQVLTLDYKDASGDYYKAVKTPLTQNQYVIDSLISYSHKENETLEFSRNPLIPYASTNRSKAITHGDLNRDGLTDFIGLGGKGATSQIYIQEKSGLFTTTDIPQNKQHAIHEDIDAIIVDVNGDSTNDLIIVSGGNAIKSGKALSPRLYLNINGTLLYEPQAFSTIEVNASTITSVDYDSDGDQDLCITADVIPQEFGTTPKQYLLENDGQGNYKDVSATVGADLLEIGNVKDIKWIDFNKNGYKDAIVIGHWMAPRLLINNGSKLSLQQNTGLDDTKGWFNSLDVADFDKDGDLDIITGNWGLNTRLNASVKEPLELYIQDFDNNGKLDPIVTYYYKGVQTPIATKDELAKQLPQLNKNYLSYSAFAKAEFKDIFPRNKIKDAQIKRVTELASVYFENKGDNTFIKRQLPLQAQISSVHDMLLEDFNNDGYIDVLLVGNDYELSTQIGRLDGSKGILLLNDKKGFFDVSEPSKFNILGASRSVQKIIIKDTVYYVVGRNNDTPLFLKKED